MVLQLCYDISCLGGGKFFGLAQLGRPAACLHAFSLAQLGRVWANVARCYKTLNQTTIVVSKDIV